MWLSAFFFILFYSTLWLSYFMVVKLGLGSDLPYRMVVHPGGDGLICALPKSCQFSESSEKTQVLYIAAITGKGGSILTWDTSSWKRISSKHKTRNPVSSFNVSPDGKFLAIYLISTLLLARGTIQGDVMLVDSRSMRIQMVVSKAHLGMATALAFSHDSRGLVSASMDSSARVTLVEDKKSGLEPGAKLLLGPWPQGPAVVPYLHYI